MKKLCCIFNYAPHYRKSIYKKIDEEFDAQFYFSDMKSDIPKIDYSEFRKKPITIRDRYIWGTSLLWRKDILLLPFKKFDHYLVIGDLALSYFPFIILCHLLGKKVYAWGHGNKAFIGRTKLWQKWFYNNCDIFFTYGENGRKRLIELGIPENKLHVIYNSLNDEINPDEQNCLKNNKIQNHFNNTLPTLLFIGRLTKVKQLDWIIKAQHYHKQKNLNYNLLIIGDGPIKDELIQLVDDKKMQDNVWFYGKCYNDDELASLIYNADLCVSPGNVGLTALHSMSYGTPVISNDDFETQMPEYETIIVGKTGELYKKDSFEDFCKKIEVWLSKDISREQIRQNCYDVINGKFNSKYQIHLLKSVIK